jgi:hypothetical protein
MRSNSLARTLGFLGGILILLGSVVTFFSGVVFAAIDRSLREGLGQTALAFEQGVVAVLLLFFVALSSARPRDYTLVAGVVLIVVSLLALILLTGGVLVLIGAILTLVAGILLVLPPR